ncbi:Aldo/keto reductase [Dacryopinax primogenitus]|uniref:Aldo/keto reductase n=1 Tax=Dacryopinax primogenitus (strain DJM 731) TaxID=1858805 RepID=M5FQB0_DACPD|nr:Aldo/keto reductase [Dacryopinax primogenitus]EJT96859.1 Aldo/keto reductase [Dacryopinax primogenitus]
MDQDENDKPKVTYHRLGNSGLRVSWPILGMMAFGSPEWLAWVKNADEALPIIKMAWDRGVNTFDTANVYSQGESERVIAKFLKTYDIPRSKVLILTKCHRLVAAVPSVQPPAARALMATRDYVNQHGLSRAAIFNAVSDSLARLETDSIDLLQIHRYDPATPAEETMEALHDLVVAGKVRYLGACTMLAWQLQAYQQVAESRGWTGFVSMQSNWSLLTREDEREVNAYCRYKGIGLIPWGPLASGLLARPLGEETERTKLTSGASFTSFETTEQDREIIRRVEGVARARGCAMGCVALAWLSGRIVSPVVGISSEQRLDEAILGDMQLTEEERECLEEP